MMKFIFIKIILNIILIKMKTKFIPIIGAISAGKSTFLQGLIGTNVFETGLSTTTKFVCLI